MSTFDQAVTIISAVGSGVAAGVFFAFSTFTMGGLRRLPPATGAAAMQSINREAPKPPLMLLLFGTGLACLVAMIEALRHLDEAAAAYQLAAASLYILGVLVVTAAYHVPRNNRLEGLDPDSDEGAAYWAQYGEEWVRMNHVRTVAPLAASGLFTIALVAG